MQLPFELDPQIIHHIIYSQAGSIGKALIELLMNSVDTRATSVHLHLSQEGFTCIDNGQGFTSRHDVINYFGRFGTPHQEGDATYGRFRLGRGQIMAHARTHWRSMNWQMQVDTREVGYNYELDDLTPAFSGCAIQGEWYEPMSDAELMSATQELRDLVRYTPVSVTLNDRVISRQPATEKWDAEDDFACVKRGRSQFTTRACWSVTTQGICGAWVASSSVNRPLGLTCRALKYCEKPVLFGQAFLLALANWRRR